MAGSGQEENTDLWVLVDHRRKRESRLVKLEPLLRFVFLILKVIFNLVKTKQNRFFVFEYCTVLYCTVLYCTVLCCTVLYCSVL